MTWQRSEPNKITQHVSFRSYAWKPLPLVYEDFSLKKSFTEFTSTPGNEEVTKGAPSVY